MLTLWRHDDCATLFHFEPMEVKQEDKVVERFHFDDSVLLLFVVNQTENSTPCNSNQNRNCTISYEADVKIFFEQLLTLSVKSSKE